MSDFRTVKEWTTKAGYKAKVIECNTDSFHWFNGYVLIPEGHGLYGQSYTEVVSGAFKEAWEAVKQGPVGKRGIVDIFCMSMGGDIRYGYLFDVHGGITYSDWEKDGREWWYGFDCNHCDDNHLVQNQAYVERECESLANQLRQFSEVTING